MAHHLHIQRISLGIFFVFIVVCLPNITWLNHGGDLCNSRSAREEKLIGPSTVNNLRLRWKFFSGKDKLATPAVADAVVYFPSWNGYLYAVNTIDGGLVWKQNLSELTGLKSTGNVVNVTVLRSTLMVAGKLLIVPIYGPAVVIAVNRSNGRLVWSTQLDPHPLAVITTSGTAYLGWMQTYTLPDNGGECGSYAGASIWGSSPAIDPKRSFAYVATGNLYTAPAKMEECQARQNNQTTPPTEPDQCIEPDVNFNSIIAFEMESGRIRWARQLGGYDVWYVACLVPNNPDCPIGPNLDADFGEAPMLITIFINGTQRDIAVAVQKSGFAWALDRDFGDIVWFRLAGPGAWVTLDARSGDILWSTANPSNEITPAPVSVANRSCLLTGKKLWSYNSGATVYGGISISYGCIYHGNGYKVGVLAQAFPTWTGGTDPYALCVEQET
ncbi:hypothetical protein BT93_G1828 [Corymbia citriodora subsp. variegata]|nr:hypothetical protein BT93_G1828 [Corymbia citriodora subsp. variegata]